MAAIKWTRADRLRVRSVMKLLYKKLGWQGIADRLELEADGSRGTVEAWSRRGRVPVAHVTALCKLVEAELPDTPVTPSMLNPQARHLEKAV